MREHIYELYKKIKRTYGTDPNEIKNSIDVEFRSADMGTMYGLYAHKSKKQCGIAVNNKLSGWEWKLTLLHELSHHFLGHKGKVFYNYGYISRQKEEFEADLLATLLFLDNEGIDIYNLEAFDNIVLPQKIYYYCKVLISDLESN